MPAGSAPASHCTCCLPAACSPSTKTATRCPRWLNTDKLTVTCVFKLIFQCCEAGKRIRITANCELQTTNWRNRRHDLIAPMSIPTALWTRDAIYHNPGASQGMPMAGASAIPISMPGLSIVRFSNVSANTGSSLIILLRGLLTLGMVESGLVSILE